jgi:ubiquinone/menaquinone biosynthesis C-methylase UbiE
MKRLYKANDYSNNAYIGTQFRRRRFQYFKKRLKNLPRPVKILDIGGTVNFWVNENYHTRTDVEITIVNLKVEGPGHPAIRVIEGDACNLHQFRDNEFDVAFSNSVIEHLFTLDNQRKMARETRRVARHYFIQTPNKYFPIEPHFKFPFFQFLPDSLKLFLQTKTSIINGVTYKKEYAEEIIKEIRLLSLTELNHLFPNSNLYVERFLGLPKSFIVHNLPDHPIRVRWELLYPIAGNPSKVACH